MATSRGATGAGRHDMYVKVSVQLQLAQELCSAFSRACALAKGSSTVRFGRNPPQIQAVTPLHLTQGCLAAVRLSGTRCAVRLAICTVLVLRVSALGANFGQILDTWDRVIVYVSSCSISMHAL